MNYWKSFNNNEYNIFSKELLSIIDEGLIMLNSNINSIPFQSYLETKNKNIIEAFNIQDMMQNDYYYTPFLNNLPITDIEYAVFLGNDKKIKNLNSLKRIYDMLDNDTFNDILSGFDRKLKINNNINLSENIFEEIKSFEDLTRYYYIHIRYTMYDLQTFQSSSVFLLNPFNKTMNIINYNSINVKMQAINEKFLIKLVNSYGFQNTYKILKFVIPDLFDCIFLIIF